LPLLFIQYLTLVGPWKGWLLVRLPTYVYSTCASHLMKSNLGDALSIFGRFVSYGFMGRRHPQFGGTNNSGVGLVETLVPIGATSPPLPTASYSPNYCGLRLKIGLSAKSS
jgi:hypothetical protein